MSKFTQYSMAIIAVTIFISFTCIYFITYGLPWSRFSSNWTIKSDEKIEEVAYRINAKFSQDSEVLTTIYLKTDATNKKLPKDASITVNGQPIESKYYNTGEAVGYKYFANIPRAKEYKLLIKRPKETDIAKVILSNNFSVKFPKEISKNRPFSLVYTADTIPVNTEPFVQFRSSTKEPILTNDQYQFGLTIPVIIQNEKIVMDSSSVLASEKIIDLRNGSIMLYVGTQFQQPDGDFLIGEEYPIEIVD